MDEGSVRDGREPGDPAALLHELLVHGAAGRAALQQVAAAGRARAGAARLLRAAGPVAARAVRAAAAPRRAARAASALAPAHNIPPPAPQ